jgi:hypothetical protein
VRNCVKILTNALLVCLDVPDLATVGALSRSGTALPTIGSARCTWADCLNGVEPLCLLTALATLNIPL